MTPSTPVMEELRRRNIAPATIHSRDGVVRCLRASYQVLRNSVQSSWLQFAYMSQFDLSGHSSFSTISYHW